MEYKVKNVMEYVVANKLEKLEPTLKCCKCKQCTSDIVAYVLNRIPAKYVASEKGELFSKIIEFDKEFEHELLILIAQAAEVVRENPLHDKAE
ncbi:late competence development ComFB family protein [Velocimicrobium porci]|uniref:Competence protein ComFB n=1 Tax=Velocimicrobium porci TaxID=2606634 RepID=A0A6L5XU93_9FIRM|nr:late competence development ComFB family protein [Velocimicrobium porci]MSS62356.1 competence protein ComFB [Velocimicrobium porci]